MTSLERGVASRVRVVVLDADGVLTDGGIYMIDSGDGDHREARRFHAHDGIAVYMLRRAGIGVAVVSGKVSAAVRERARELGIDEIHQVDPYHKLRAVQDILDREGVGWEQAACLADDLADLPVLMKVGLPAAVANAVPEVMRVARWVGSVEGGRGAVREFAEALLRSRGEWSDLVDSYVEHCLAEWEAGSDA